MFESLLVANRGEIARRVIRTAKRLGIRTVAVYSEADAGLPFVARGRRGGLLGPADPARVLPQHRQAILAAAADRRRRRSTPATASSRRTPTSPGRSIDAGLIWVGPSPDAITAMGDKINARNLMAAAGVPVAPGTHDPVGDVEAAVEAAAAIGYPVMVKAAAGGGGMGMASPHDEDELRARVREGPRLRRAHSSATPRPARALLPARAPRRGADPRPGRRPRGRPWRARLLGAAPEPEGRRGVAVARRSAAELRERMLAAAVKAGEAVGYRNAGTVECLVDPATQDFVFLEMNTRLQVEHPITELVTASTWSSSSCASRPGSTPAFDPDAVRPPATRSSCGSTPRTRSGSCPARARSRVWVEPTGEGVRVDSGYAAGTTVTPFYDSLMAKLVRLGRRPRRGARPGARRGRAASRSSAPRPTCRSSPSCWRTRSSCPATTTPA